MAKSDMDMLVENSAFRRFLFAIVEASGIGIPASKDDTALRLEGKRALGLEILGWVDEALTNTTSSGQPFAALHLAITEALTPKEKRSERTSRYDESH